MILEAGQVYGITLAGRRGLVAALFRGRYGREQATVLIFNERLQRWEGPVVVYRSLLVQLPADSPVLLAALRYKDGRPGQLSLF
jgi:hypothetical protein